MKIFNAPAWDVDGSATTLCNNFSGNQNSSRNKKVHKKKHKTKRDSCNEGSGELKSNISDGPRLNVNANKMGQRKGVQKVRTTSEQNNSKRKEMRKGKKFSESANSGSVQTSKETSYVKNSTDTNKGNFVLTRRMPETGFSTVDSHNKSKQKSQKGMNLQPKDLQRDHTLASKTLASKSPKAKKTRRGKKKIESQNHNDSVDNSNKNRKRNVSHLMETQTEVQRTKKRKVENNFSHNRMAFSDKKQTFNRKHPKNEDGQHSENFLEVASRNNNLKNSNDRINKGAEKKLNNKGSKQALQPAIKQMKGKSDQSQEPFKSPYFGKNVFHDSSLSLRERMLLQLKSSRFRYINEQLYTSKSNDAEDMFKNDPELFKIYHDGFKRQVEQWPLNPVERIIAAIKRRPVNLVVADFGCGDATLAKSVPNEVHSFDLVALSDEVTVCDMAHTPLGNGSVDICVFCLSLMGTNLSGYLAEANRVLTVGGNLKIAEVASRFDSVDQFIKIMKKYGFAIINKDLSHELFYFLNFKKESNVKYVKSLPNLSLKPCLYKKR